MPTYPSDGRITSLFNYTAALTGTELMVLVAPGNAAAGVNYNVTTQFLAAQFNSIISGNPTILTNSNTYTASSDLEILYDRISSITTTFLQLPAAASRSGQALVVKDIAGNASATAPIYILTAPGENVENYTSLPIVAPFGGFRIAPLTGQWYISP